MTLPTMPAFIGSQTVEDRLVRAFLQIHIQRGVDLQAALVHLVRSVFSLKIAANFLYKVWGQ